ncbi:MAG TPA: hypothetical protein VFK38_01865 [Candidatus Limnocylindrales bacterium]|nr:hypothetical protein [Candidatus Limnocylindrales bacterium]
MDTFRLAELQFRIEHRHGGGEWGEMRPREHGPADHDQERAWGKGRIFRCDQCHEEIRVVPEGDPGEG